MAPEQKSQQAEAPTLASIKARRVTGGAIVTVRRSDGRQHRYQVGLRRYNRLLDMVLAHTGLYGGAFLRSGFECNLRYVSGFADARRWAARHSRSRAKHWKDSGHGGTRAAASSLAMGVL